MRFTAFAVSMQAGMAGTVQIAIERWISDVERQMLIDTLRPGFQQDALPKALQGIKLRNGYIRTPNSMGWDLKYARQNPLPDAVVKSSSRPTSR